MVRLFCLLIAVLFAAPVEGQLFRMRSDCPGGVCPPRVVQRSVVQTSYVSPAGYHRHVTFDGTVIEHGDWNFGDPGAHWNVPRPWLKYTGPKAPVRSAARAAVQQTAKSARVIATWVEPVPSAVVGRTRRILGGFYQ